MDGSDETSDRPNTPRILWSRFAYVELEASSSTADSQRPAAIPLHAHSIPDILKSRDQWVCWDWSARRDSSKPPGEEDYWGKPPISPITAGYASESNPATWSSFEEAVSFAQSFGLSGVGYVLTQEDPFTCIDIDNCRDSQTGELTHESLKLVSLLHSYSELSPSGTGLHIWIEGDLGLGHDRSLRMDPELFDRSQYITVTGHHLTITPNQPIERREELKDIPNRTKKHYSNIGTFLDDHSLRGVCVHNDVVVTINWHGTLSAADSTTGDKLWSIHTGQGSILAMHGDDVIFSCNSKTIHAINTISGKTIWTKSTSIVESIYIYKDIAIFEESNDNEVIVNAYNAESGDSLWSRSIGSFETIISTSVFLDIDTYAIKITGFTSSEEVADIEIPIQISSGSLTFPNSTLYSTKEYIIPTGSIHIQRNSAHHTHRYDSMTISAAVQYPNEQRSYPNNEIEISSSTQYPGRIIARGATTRDHLWNHSIQGSTWAYPIATNNSHVFVLERTFPKLYAFDIQTGKTIWE